MIGIVEFLHHLEILPVQFWVVVVMPKSPVALQTFHLSVSCFSLPNRKQDKFKGPPLRRKMRYRSVSSIRRSLGTPGGGSALWLNGIVYFPRRPTRTDPRPRLFHNSIPAGVTGRSNPKYCRNSSCGYPPGSRRSPSPYQRSTVWAQVPFQHRYGGRSAV